MDLPALRRCLLALVGNLPEDLSQRSAQDWQAIDRLAALHRLQPLLHFAHADNTAIPSAIRAGWRTSHRAAAMQALASRAALEDCCLLLDNAGHQPIALKGAWLGTHAYPDPALRPMRDLDIWVPVEGVLGAYQVLLEHGYAPFEPPEMTLVDIVRLDKHMPPLRSPRGIAIELHHRLWEPEGRLDHPSPTADEAAIRARSQTDADGIRMLDPQDTLAHLIVHAVYSHRLDCGPLLLSDIDFLLRRAPSDWPRFWAEARAGNWQQGARLVLELVQRWRPGAVVELTGDPAPAELVEAAPDLLLQELDTRQSAQLAATTLKAGPARLVERLRGRRSAAGQPTVTREMGHEGGLIGWAASRAWRSASQLARADVRRQSRQLAALSKWLDQ